MAIQQPSSTDKQNSPDHSLSHRVFANDSTSPVKSVVVDSVGNVGIGTDAPTARMHLPAGSASANTSPLKFTSGPLVAAVEAGAMEFSNNSLWFSNLAVRRTVVQGQNVFTSDQTISNTTSETAIFTQAHGANYLKVGKMEDVWIQGVVNTASGANDTGTVRVKYNGAILGSFVIPKNVTNKNIEIHVVTTCRSVGAGTTSVQLHANADIDGFVSDPIVNVLSTGHDSTSAQPTIVTVQWTTASTSNNIVINQTRALSIDNNS